MSSTTTSTSPRWSQSATTEQQQDLITRIYEGNALVIAQAGSGKTVCAQTAIQELITDGHLQRAIIFAPLKVCQLTWAVEWQDWEHLWEPEVATGAAPMRTHLCRHGGRIVVMNLDNMAWFFKNDLHTYFDGILVDEVSKLKDPGSKTFMAIRHKLKHFTHRWGMSATPVHQAREDIYAQMLFIDDGETLGRNKERFMRKYFMQMDYMGYNWDFQPGGAERLAAAVAPMVFLMDTEQYEADLPHLEDVIVPVALPQKVWDAYEAMCASMVSQIDDEVITAANAAVKQGKLQQLCCGSVYNLEGTAVFMHSEKFIALHTLLDDHPEPFMVVYQFQYELEQLRALYPEALVLGDNPELAQREWNAGRCSLLLVHPKSASHGINLQKGGCRMVWLSPVWSADQWDQTVRRLRRRGQPSDTVWRYILLVLKSVEPLILARHTENMDDASAFIQHIREVAQ